MAVIRLIRGLSYSDGYIKATKEKPEVIVSDARVLRYLATGDFELICDTAAQAANFVDGGDMPDPAVNNAEDEQEPVHETNTNAQEPLKDRLAKQTADDLKAYADAKGIDLGKAAKKADIIAVIVESEKKANEARAALRKN